MITDFTTFIKEGLNTIDDRYLNVGNFLYFFRTVNV